MLMESVFSVVNDSGVYLPVQSFTLLRVVASAKTSGSRHHQRRKASGAGLIIPPHPQITEACSVKMNPSQSLENRSILIGGRLYDWSNFEICYRAQLITHRISRQGPP